MNNTSFNKSTGYFRNLSLMRWFTKLLCPLLFHESSWGTYYVLVLLTPANFILNLSFSSIKEIRRILVLTLNRFFPITFLHEGFTNLSYVRYFARVVLSYHVKVLLIPFNLNLNFSFSSIISVEWVLVHNTVSSKCFFRNLFYKRAFSNTTFPNIGHLSLIWYFCTNCHELLCSRCIEF